MGKLIFFDIDGTLVDFNGEIPVSTKVALLAAKEEGHKMFLCTGRSRTQIYPWLYDYGFSGAVSSAGASVTSDGKEIFHRIVEMEELRRFVSYFEPRQICYALQTASGVVMTRSAKEQMERRFLRQGMPREKIDAIFGGTTISAHPEETPDVEKMIYYDAIDPVSVVQEELGDYYDVLPASYDDPDDYCGEVTIRGVNKATGMQALLDYFHMTREDTVAFGDGPNDLDMLKFAGIGVAMGNGYEQAKACADMVTSHIQDDGISNALKKLKLIS
ncbi:MAG: HAD family hydrolase [Lachnospiraceae bacterium]|nr:HAD family hydrolase [Lachnospiraceae bacterium]